MAEKKSGYSATAKWLVASPFKVRPVADLIRKKPYTEAIAILDNMPHKGAQLIKKVLVSAASNALNNVGFYSNPRVDELLHQGLATADESQRDALYKEAQKILWDDAAWVFLYVPDNVWGMGANVSNAWVQPDGIAMVRYIEVK